MRASELRTSAPRSTEFPQIHQVAEGGFGKVHKRGLPPVKLEFITGPEQLPATLPFLNEKDELSAPSPLEPEPTRKLRHRHTRSSKRPANDLNSSRKTLVESRGSLGTHHQLGRLWVELPVHRHPRDAELRGDSGRPQAGRAHLSHLVRRDRRRPVLNGVPFRDITGAVAGMGTLLQSASRPITRSGQSWKPNQKHTRRLPF